MNDRLISFTPLVDQLLNFTIGPSELIGAHSFVSCDTTTVASGKFCDFTFSTFDGIMSDLIHWNMEHSGSSFFVDFSASFEHIDFPLFIS